jgi:transcriptional regulator with XRE-family HTH domain
MRQTEQLVDTLKAELKRQRRTYADVAAVLGLSEASVKRLFSRSSFSLKRLERLCDWLGMDLVELVRRMQAARARVSVLSETQERELVSDLRLLLVTVCLLNRWEFDDIVATYQLTEAQIIACMGRLDRMGLIELLPGNRSRLLVARDFAWIVNGPIQQFFASQVQDEFFDCRFDGPGEVRLVVNGMLSAASNAELIQRIHRLGADFHDLHRGDEHRPVSQRHGTTLVMAMRPWEVSIFASLRRAPNRKHFG